MPGAPAPDLDRILERIRAEARSRGAREHVGTYGVDAASAGPRSTHGLPMLKCVHVSDFMSLPLDVFLDEAYRRLIGRPPDEGGGAHYQRAMLRGKLTRIEVLGRLQFSHEARSRGARIAGVTLAFALAMVYRIPVIGPIAAAVARLLALPAHLRDRSTVEAIAAASGQWMRR